MKKIVFSLLIMLTFNFCEAQKFRGGIVAGIANTDVKGTDPQDVDFNKVGLTAGVFTELPFNEKSSLRMEMNFIQKGSYIPPIFKADTVPNGPDTSLQLRLHYVEFPFLYSHTVTINFGSTAFKKLGYEIGPAIGFLVSSSVNLNQNGFGPIVGTPYKRYDISGVIGFFYHFTEHFTYHFRYENSILPIRKHPGGSTAYYNLHFNVGEVNMVFTNTLCYTF